MRPKESVIENYLCDRVKAAGGEVRKVVYPGRRGAPDRLVLLPGVHAFVELKRPGEVPRPEQKREALKLQGAGCIVVALDTKDAVDGFMLELEEKRHG